MSQFDVYINPNEATRDAFPFLVDIQTSLISSISTRIVVPLGKFSHFNSEQITRLTPVIEYQQSKLLLLTPQIASIPVEMLNEPVSSLAHYRDEIIASLDFAITGI
ncbi:MAG: CcdB family protein [Immundisolibacteraceae bacterium]|nr:CcdB family protein [Immundisolibacteraceae bacterium]